MEPDRDRHMDPDREPRHTWSHTDIWNPTDTYMEPDRDTYMKPNRDRYMEPDRDTYMEPDRE